ncbi:MAG: phosphoribosylformylglycinamidine cyclo-ligase [Sphingobacteriales bacterium]|nr:phosphoribosylformylglycinamidine cyclo-ligase [Sphingobacteriales bacterium]MBP9141968.1 hypothetical protein [Chitinophagales bacterium]MDA0198852.1 AIR synthase-related protein [Bacteroidota bacterium]MBK6890218.1 phosphoribosylformylglycinamidine cyclo-ligase [Sphingobacteriales bacterium]MBK7527255.1 phosphoribosylformylglycinamidine cyclo-ligase [Sphingobacteriales bacterium]
MDNKLPVTTTASSLGVDHDLGNTCSKNAYAWAKKTFANRHNLAGEPVLKTDGGFANLLQFNGQKIGITSDGIGTKVELAERTGIYHTLGFDLVAMVADDLAAAGLVPTNLSNILDVDRLNYNIVDALMQGLHDAANFCQIAVTGGEIAELGNRIGGWGNNMHFNWCSTAIGILHPALLAPLDGSEITSGQAVITLYSPGFRSNGFSAARRILAQNYGSDDWHQAQFLPEQKTWGEVLLTPCTIYTPLVTQLLNDGVALSGVAHITGGGIAENLARLLRLNQLGATLPTLFNPHQAMQQLVQWSKMPPAEAYRTWNMANGLLLISPTNQVNSILQQAQNMGYKAQLAGEVLPNTTQITMATPYGQLTHDYAKVIGK